MADEPSDQDQPEAVQEPPSLENPPHVQQSRDYLDEIEDGFENYAG